MEGQRTEQSDLPLIRRTGGLCLPHQGEVESRHLACGQLGDPAGAGPTVEALEGVIVEGTEIQSIQDIQRTELRETNRRSREIRRRGRSLRNKLAAGVQSVFGVDSMASSRACRRTKKSSSWKRSSRR